MSGDIDRVDPDFDTIVKLCINELEIKFPNYGNIWLEQDDIYYKERLMKEVTEYVESMTIDSERRKLLNIVNIACMAHQTAKANRGCRNHIPTFEDIMRSRDTEVDSLCTVCGVELYIKNGIIYPMDMKK